MPNNKAAKHHEDASNSYGHAKDQSAEASKQYKAGNHEKGAHHATNAQGHATKGNQSLKEANKTHAEAHSDKK